MAKVLIIDDDKITRYALSEIIQYEGFDVDEAEDGQKGLSMIKEGEYNIILCDILMPKMDGLEVLENVKELDVCSPIVMISARSEIEVVIKAIKRGAFDFISKPIDMNRFVVTIHNAIKYFELAKEIRMLKGKIKKFNDIVDHSDSIAQVKEMLVKGEND